MIKDQMKKYSYALVVLILLTLNITKVVSFNDSVNFNMALSDVFIPFFLVLSVFFWKKYGFNQVYRYAMFWVCLVFWIVLVAFLAMKNTLILDAGWKGLVEELVKTGLCIIYFIVGYNTLNVMTLKTFSFRWSISTLIFVMGGFIIYILAIKGMYYWSDDPKYLRFFMGTDTDPNHAATFLTLSFFGMGIFAVLSKKVNMKIYFYAVMFVSTVGLIFTGSRGGLISFSISIIVLLCYYAYDNWRVALALVLVLILMLMVFFTIDHIYFESVFTQRLMYKLVDIESGLEVRAHLSRVAWLMGVDYPIFGVGRGNFILNSPRYFDQLGIDYIDDIPHNTYFGLIAETGLIGLLLFCMPFILFIYNLYKRYKNNHLLIIEEMPILIWIIAGVFALGLQAFVLNIENRRFLWYLAGLLIYIFENDIFIVIKHSKSINIKHLNLGLIGLLFTVLITSIFTARSVHIPYIVQKIDHNYKFEILYKEFNVGQIYELGIKLSISQNEDVTDRVLLLIVEQSKEGTKKVLDSYSYKGAYGVVVRNFTPTMDNSKIYLKILKLDHSLNNYAVTPIYLQNNDFVFDLTQWYFLQPESIMSLSLVENRMDYENWFKQTDLSFGIKTTFENQLSVESISIDQNDHFNTEVTVNVRVLEDIRLNLIPSLRGYPENLHVMDENRIPSGSEWYNLLDSIETSTWKSGEMHKLAFAIPRQHGIYALKLGFYHIVNYKNVYMGVDSEKEPKEILLDLGWLNLDSFTEGIVYE